MALVRNGRQVEAGQPVDGARTTEGPALVVRDVERWYGDVQAVAGASLTIERGTIVTLLGPSGCGKSTLLRAVAGIERVQAGEIEIGGRLVSSARRQVNVAPERRRLGMVFQSYALWPHMTVKANVEEPLRNLKVAPSARRQRRQDALAAVRLNGFEHRYPGELSGGQQQRVSLARALVGDPEVLLFDEPLSNLDAQLRDDMRIEIKRLQLERNLTMLYVTHDQQEALSLSDRILVMQDGLVLQAGAPEELYQRPASLAVARFLGASNTMRGVLQGPDEVRLEDGSSMRCRVTDARPGDRVAVVCRPSAFRVAADDHGEGSVPVRVLYSGFLGTVYEHSLRLASGEQILARTTTSLSTDTDVRVVVDPSQAYAYPDESA